MALPHCAEEIPSINRVLESPQACVPHLGADRVCDGNYSPGTYKEYAICMAKGARAARNLAGKHQLEPGRVKAVLVAIMPLTVSLNPLEEHQEHELLLRVGRNAICKSRIKIRR